MKASRWRIQLTGEDVDGASDVEINGVALARFAFERFADDNGVDEDQLAQRLMHMEQRYAFQWYWMNEADWSHENLEGLMDMDGLDAKWDMHKVMFFDATIEIRGIDRKRMLHDVSEVISDILDDSAT